MTIKNEKQEAKRNQFSLTFLFGISEGLNNAELTAASKMLNKTLGTIYQRNAPNQSAQDQKRPMGPHLR